MLTLCRLFLDYGNRVSHKPATQPKDQSNHGSTNYKPTELRKGHNNSFRHGSILSDNLASRHPTVNQSFIDRIVEEIQAKHPIFGKEKFNKSETLQQLIDNVADSVVKQVTEEINTGQNHEPSQRVNAPKPPAQKNAKPADHKESMPILNDHPRKKPHVKSAAFLESVIKKLASKKEDLSPEMISSDDINGNSSPGPSLEDVNPSSVAPSTPRTPQPEEPGQQEIRQLFRFKHPLNKKRPLIQSGRRKLTIPATTEGKEVCR